DQPAYAGEIGERRANIRQDHIRAAARMQVSGNLVEIAADLAEMAKHLPHGLGIGRHAPLGARASFTGQNGAGEGGGSHACLVCAGKEGGLFMWGQTDKQPVGAPPLLGFRGPWREAPGVVVGHEFPRLFSCSQRTGARGRGGAIPSSGCRGMTASCSSSRARKLWSWVPGRDSL